MTGRIVWDGRWVGRNGIARHAYEVGRRLQGAHEILGPGRVSPTSPLDALYLRTVLRLGPGDLFVSPGFNASLPGRHKQLITVHDLIHLRIDDESSCAKRLYYERIVLPAIRSAQRVLTVSQYSRHELIEWTGLQPEDVVCVGNGCSLAPATPLELNREVKDERQAILYVGNSKPHKNFPLLIKAMGHMRDNVRAVTVGVADGYVARECVAFGVERARFDVLRGVSDGDLRELYLKAACVALPSTYEGFGLAALEGMAVGTPTAYVCDAVHEVVGPLGFRSANATNGEAYADAILQAMAIEEKAKHDLAQRAMTFSWDDVANLVGQQIAHACG